MQKIYQNPSNLEKVAKAQYCIPPFLMMENAARALADFILDFAPETVLILCGKGNNGGDGYALARLLQNKCQVSIISIEDPAAEEARAQYEMCRLLGLEASSSLELPEEATIIVDCIYGTGFHGQLPENVKKLLDEANKSPAIKIACDISSGLYFKADYTITMGCQKLSLYSDTAKEASGKIIVADLGIAREKFESQSNIYLIDPDDRQLPLRKNRAFHKGRFGHTAVICGDKAGAAILAASAAMNFGSGLTSLVKTPESKLEQFKLSPSLMISDSLPQKTSCVSLGSGFSSYPVETASMLLEWFNSSKTQSPAAVLDAGILTAPETPELLANLNKVENARIILTPHLSELSRLLELCKAEGDVSVKALAENPEAKVAAGNFLTKMFPKTTIIMKSANTFIACAGQTYIVTDGAQSLAKGGSGDILAGLAASLLAQGYSALSAAITAAEHHALLSKELGSEAYNLTPEKLLEKILC